jgi:hypothetical protein
VTDPNVELQTTGNLFPSRPVPPKPGVVNAQMPKSDAASVLNQLAPGALIGSNQPDADYAARVLGLQ